MDLNNNKFQKIEKEKHKAHKVIIICFICKQKFKAKSVSRKYCPSCSGKMRSIDV